MTSGFLRSNPPCYTPPAAQSAAMMTKMENLNLDQLLHSKQSAYNGADPDPKDPYT